MVVLTPPSGMAHQYPVSGTITGAAKTAGINERFCEVNRMAVDSFPVRCQHARRLSQNVRCQVWHLDPGQNQKAGVVGEEADVPPARLRVPADVAVAATQVSRRRTPRQACDRPALCPDKYFRCSPTGCS